MEKRQLTRKEVEYAVSKVLDFEEAYLLEKAVEALCKGNSILVDAVRYAGGGNYEKRTLKNRYKYKLIVPIVDSNNLCYSTDLFKTAENAIKADYECYYRTQQLVVDVITEIPCDYAIERFGHGYKNGEYGIYKIEVIK